MVCSRGESLKHHSNQMKLFNAITTAVVVGGSFVATAVPASAQYYGTETYTVRPRANGFQVRDSSGNYTNYTNRGGGGYNYNDSTGGYGQIRFR